MARSATLQRVQDKGKNFVPNQRIFLLFANVNYSNRRNEEGYAEFMDLPAAEKDIENTK